ncbi:hypothetical protein RV11_GL001188 [Enterococcus phoeniculicola]|uniref:Uncharacterized protein n=1 Tax=Enterococcus phoeniculicola ATCC BAA-412 TaxID=1158610 RepID=R3WE04_9ENTE|nr:hypothetical protein [Enterococcus phoeniculicola]EOL46086.1 hypothetical protein UC3_00891 [Enterococcus phoeniculicola ATCC BAA-412]EOT77069.1 hypothetical protein I589_02031 [Enterococcus phoeniculicola ATCC BAA-412]OJG73408.1 hypothetical protein RV11_GL001188 [Enterococcus phoeniculicola]
MKKASYIIVFSLSNGKEIQVTFTTDKKDNPFELYQEVLQEKGDFYRVMDDFGKYHNIHKKSIIDIEITPVKSSINDVQL